MYTLGDRDEDRGVIIDRVIHGLFNRPQLRYRNIETFNTLTEIERMYTTYHKQKAKKDAWNKRVKQFEENVPL